MDENEDEIPPYLRKEAKAPIDHARWYLDVTDVRMAWLAERGLRPHAAVFEARKHCVEFLAGKVANLEIERFLGRRTYGAAPQKMQPNNYGGRSAASWTHNMPQPASPKGDS